MNASTPRSSSVSADSTNAPSLQPSQNLATRFEEAAEGEGEGAEESAHALLRLVADTDSVTLDS
jgi:hypothetical protein